MNFHLCSGGTSGDSGDSGSFRPQSQVQPSELLQIALILSLMCPFRVKYSMYTYTYIYTVAYRPAAIFSIENH